MQGFGQENGLSVSKTYGEGQVLFNSNNDEREHQSSLDTHERLEFPQQNSLILEVRFLTDHTYRLTEDAEELLSHPQHCQP